jgi:hypothetical protein
MITKGKKGELTTEQIVLIIILIVSFAIILFFLVRLNLGKTSDMETCHNSVVTRSSKVLPQDSIPLNCKTRYICISQDGSCETMSNSNVEKAKTKTEVYSILANEMADCWWQFGEGKLNYVGNTFASDLYCSLCDQVFFDNSVNTIFPEGEISQKDFYGYLESTNVSGKDISYLEYLNNIKKVSEFGTDSKFGSYEIGKYYYIMMGIFSEKGIEKWIGAGAGAGTVLTIMTIVVTVGTGGLAAIPIGIGAAAGGGVGWLLGTTSIGDSGKRYLSPTIIRADSESLESLQCKSISTLG